jgi:hypothetical protein
MEVFSAASLAALVWKFISVVKMVTGKDLTGVVTQALTWAAGIIAVVLAAQADVSASLTVFGGQALGALDGWSQILAGLALASAASATYDVKKAIDNTDSSSEPKLGGGRLDRTG